MNPEFLKLVLRDNIHCQGHWYRWFYLKHGIIILESHDAMLYGKYARAESYISPERAGS